MEEKKEQPVICEILQRLNASGALTTAALADVLNLSMSGAYPYLTNRDADYAQVRTLVRRSGNQRLQEAILVDLTRGTGWVVAHIPPSLDVNGDGDIDMHDVVSKSVDGLAQTGTFVRDALKSTTRDITDSDFLWLREHAQAMVQHAATIQQIVDHLAEQHASRPSARKPARPAQTGGAQ